MEREDGGVWARSRRALTVGIVASITLSALELLAVATALPAVADDLGRTGYGVAIGAFPVASVLGVLLGGPAADRFGPARPYLVAVVAFAAGLVVAGVAQTMPQFIAGRAIQGLGAGATTPILYAAIGRGYPERSQLRMFSLTSTAWVVPGVIGPGLAGVVTDQFGWRWVFVGLLPALAVAAMVTVAGLRSVPPVVAVSSAGLRPRSKPGSEPGPEPGSGLRGSTVIIALVFTLGAALVLAGTGASSWPAAVALVGLGLAVGTGAARAGSLLPAGVVTARAGAPAAVASRFLLLYAFVAVDAFVPLAVTDVRGRTVVIGSIAVTAGTLTWAAGTWTAERLVERRGAGVVVRAAFVVLAAGVAVQFAYLTPALPLIVGFVGTAVAGFGTGLAYGLQSALVLAAAPDGGEGQASSALSLADTLAFAAAPAITGLFVAVADRSGGSLAPALAAGWAIGAAIAVVGAAVGSRAGRGVTLVPGMAST